MALGQIGGLFDSATKVVASDTVRDVIGDPSLVVQAGILKSMKFNSNYKGSIRIYMYVSGGMTMTVYLNGSAIGTSPSSSSARYWSLDVNVDVSDIITFACNKGDTYGTGMYINLKYDYV